jgi:FlaA1/EpsC-like NDP-sugar epimerase
MKTIKQLSRNKKRILMIITDLILLPLSMMVAFVLRFGDMEAFSLYEWDFGYLALLPLIAFPIFIPLGLYRAVIRYVESKALFTILKGVSVHVLLLFALVKFFDVLPFPRSILILYWMLVFFSVSGSRLLAKYILYNGSILGNMKSKIAIYGAGRAGVQLVNILKNSIDYQVVTFIDDNKNLQNQFVNGIKVVSPKLLRKHIEKIKIEKVFIAIPSASKSQRSEILKKLETMPIHVKMLPNIGDVVQGKIQVSDLNDIEIDDVLGRDQIEPKIDLMQSCICDKVVMVTGAGGSIGSELCRQILSLKPQKIVLFDRSEYNLYLIERELNELKQINIEAFSSIEIIAILGSVTNHHRIKSVIKALKIQTLYHAAAYKHVPLVEINPVEGAFNNIFGTQYVAEGALAAGVETFILISTDKAVRPTNTMGATKRFAEQIIQEISKENSKTRFSIVRFGNVLNSSGSVIPLFQKQIKKGGPITVTHPDITRYFMTIPEAVQLVIQAGAMGKNGDVFVLDMGKPVKIYDLAVRLIHLSGFRVKNGNSNPEDIEIQFNGLRPGEKLYEELLIGENVSGTDHPRIMRAEEKSIPWDKIQFFLKQLDKACTKFNQKDLRRILLDAVDDFKPQCGIQDYFWLNGGKK